MKFFIVGTGRCGTTLLQRMLNSHPDLYVFPETHWIPKLHEQFGATMADTRLMIDIVKRTNHVTGLPTTSLDEEEFQEYSGYSSEMTVQEFCDGLGRFFASQSGKHMWADKTPDYGYCMTTLQSIWPECKFVHLLRNGVAVAQSMSKHIGYQALAHMGQLFWCPVSMDFAARPAPDTQLSPELFVRLWYRRMMRTRDEAQRLSKGSYHELRYENLLSEPTEFMREICDFVGVDANVGWMGEATKLIVQKVSAPSCSEGFFEYFSDREKQYLAELGYSKSGK